MGDWLRHIALNAKARSGFGPQLVVWFLIAVVALVLAVGFLCAALFVWRARLELAARSHAGWLDPKFLTVGIEIGRAIGWRRVVMLAAAGLLAAGLGKEWFGSGARKPKEPDGD
jgi:hypothetical protein